MNEKTSKLILNAQRSELSEHILYAQLAKSMKDEHNKKVLEHISNDELKHHDFWKQHTQKDVKPKKFMIFWFYFLAKTLGLTFAVKLMERKESKAQDKYNAIAKIIPGAAEIEKDEQEHEQKILNMLNEEKLEYVGSIVLGLNDALVELTGAIAGLTFAFMNNVFVGIAALITGIAASFSMAASEYLATKTDARENKNPFKASIYTGIAYIITVSLLVCPFFLTSSPILAVILTLVIAATIILCFTFYTSVAKDMAFGKRFWEMILISFGVAFLSFIVGIIVKLTLGIEI
jgi:vacuolar iron transporter family protein